MADWWQLVKPRQTALLVFTGLVGHASASAPIARPGACAWLSLAGSLVAAIAGATILNMVYDRDVDAVMRRTRHRPLAEGRVDPARAALAGLWSSWLGIGWAFALAPLYGAVVLLGWVLDVAVYTMWLKRRTVWAVVVGGLAGGMPVLAGRVLAAGRVDVLGVLLAFSVVVWIPTHIMTFSVKYAADYRAAGIPVFPNRYGVKATQYVVGLSTLLAAQLMLTVTWLLSVPLGYLGAGAALSAVLIGLAANALVSPDVQRNIRLFRFASVYMLGSMGLVLLARA
ncbi:protoheme IX farnesyltransferase [Caldinitratiruptor microaerophilus]|uniref:heme o synthase n=1 Tax=Caldinitratiruptor microaerophilus TaxID=671077 RepID=A0AA35CPR0_9FIRM|nr:protoheme IX farnesyltransferase [Caldinitratiruptor microaerophilus]